ncbi:hypothetical protein D0817_10695 [Flavobacterium cupreum]|uniref:Uncharacterized protein n=1 Tax=Flavobacterium cupreum TaxID=2133766 RepID=A0A434A787_9FLAO|nr:hypothetical protein [Flavobacterium cupreum]RUT70279.1 hypothetical protein D0817_10695 [Flavobacterium cupreum]
MKKIIVICFLLLSSKNLVAQEIKNLSFILVVDDEIISTKSKLTFIISTDTSTENLPAQYYPGTLSLSKLDYEKLISPATKTIYLKYHDTVYVDGKATYYDFEIEYQKAWLQDLYNILRIYDLNSKKNKKKFDPLSSTKNYTFELTSSNTTFLRIRKK